MKHPLSPRQLKARMVLCGLDLTTVAARAGVPYSVASEILSGTMQRPQHLAKLRRIIEEATPLESLTLH